MLYLIKSGTYLKIGYTYNVEKSGINKQTKQYERLFKSNCIN